MPTPLVSVIIPSYNHAPYVRQAVESALAQSVRVEVLVRDDASTDESWDVLQAIDDPRVRLWRNDVNLGAHETLQRALADARITAIEKTIAELDAARRALVGLSRQCAAADTVHCPIISAFEQV